VFLRKSAAQTSKEVALEVSEKRKPTNLSDQVLHHRGHVDRGSTTDSLRVFPLSQETMDSTDGELETRASRSRFSLALSRHLATSSHRFSGGEQEDQEGQRKSRTKERREKSRPHTANEIIQKRNSFPTTTFYLDTIACKSGKLLFEIFVCFVSFFVWRDAKLHVFFVEIVVLKFDPLEAPSLDTG
jgi:hypothetical protein